MDDGLNLDLSQMELAECLVVGFSFLAAIRADLRVGCGSGTFFGFRLIGTEVGAGAGACTGAGVGTGATTGILLPLRGVIGA